MRICVNGESMTLDAACTVAELLKRLDLGRAACAVEVNARLVPKADHPGHTLADGDAVEIVTLVGGG
ncbi:MAG: sulfur carrier protein ThiS [Planctomycetota bacterium]|jgi:thiamine biosynthesis protein ThiS